MIKFKRNIGLEILEGLREIKRGEYGRVVNVLKVSGIREQIRRGNRGTRINNRFK